MTGECTQDSELPLILLRKICSAECVSHLNGLLGEEGVWSGLAWTALACCAVGFAMEPMIECKQAN